MSTEGMLAPVRQAMEGILARMEASHQVREEALRASREIIRTAARTIRAVHREEWDAADELLASGRRQLEALKALLADHPELYWTGYVLDAQKEHAEAALVHAAVRGAALPTPEDLGVEDSAYLNALGEMIGELRRHVLDCLRRGRLERAEVYLEVMDETLGFLVTVDYPDALTGGLRRTADVARSLVERTRGDLTAAYRQEVLVRALAEFEARLQGGTEAPGETNL